MAERRRSVRVPVALAATYEAAGLERLTRISCLSRGGCRVVDVGEAGPLETRLAVLVWLPQPGGMRACRLVGEVVRCSQEGVGLRFCTEAMEPADLAAVAAFVALAGYEEPWYSPAVSSYQALAG